MQFISFDWNSKYLHKYCRYCCAMNQIGFAHKSNTMILCLYDVYKYGGVCTWLESTGSINVKCEHIFHINIMALDAQSAQIKTIWNTLIKRLQSAWRPISCIVSFKFYAPLFQDHFEKTKWFPFLSLNISQSVIAFIGNPPENY